MPEKASIIGQFVLREGVEKSSSLMLRWDLQSRRPLDYKSSGSLDKRFSTLSCVTFDDLHTIEYNVYSHIQQHGDWT